jgi:membrane protease YdiL (CAAX protease family)
MDSTSEPNADPAIDLNQSTPQPQVPVAQGPTRNHILYGPFGLRAGWSLLIYFGIIAIFAAAGFGIAHQVEVQRQHTADIAAARTGKPAPKLPPLSTRPDPTKPTPLSSMIVGEAFTFGLLFLLSWLMSAIEHRRLSAYGLGGTRSPARFLTGALWGLAAMGLLILILHAFRLLTFDSQLDHGTSILFWGAIQLFAFLLVGLTEEYTMRGYLQFTLTRGLVSVGNRISAQHARAIGFWIAALITSTLFVLAHTHNSGENPVGLFQVFLAGVVFVVALWRTGSLWWAIGFHTTWDWSQSFLYGVPDSGGLMQGRLFATHAVGPKLYSGGSVGPEGSVLCIPVLLLVIAGLLLLTPSSPQPPLETTDASPVDRGTCDMPLRIDSYPDAAQP